MRTILAVACAVLVAGAPALAQTDGPPPTPPPEPLSAPPPPPPVLEAPPPRPVTRRPRPPEPPRRLNRLTFSPLPLFVLALGVEYERVVNDSVSFFVGPTFVATGLLLRSTGLSVFGGSLDTGIRVFPLQGDLAPMGFWTGPQLNFSLTALGAGGSSVSAYTGSLVAMAGYSYIADGGFTVSCGVGLGAAYGSTLLTAGGSFGVTDPLLGLAVALHFNLGGAF